MTKLEITQLLATTNGYQYNLLKTAEELTELSEVLLKKVNKMGGPKEPSDQDIIEEIGDVGIRLMILTYLFDQKAIEERINFKLKKYEGWINEGKFTGNI